MIKRAETRNYRMSDATLIKVADDLMNSAQRDINELAEYGFVAINLTGVKILRDSLWDTPPDEQLSADMVGATNLKNEARRKLLLKVKNVSDRAKLQFGEKSAKYRKFDVDGLSRQNDTDLERTGRWVYKTALEYEAELSQQGLTTIMLQNLQTATANFTTALFKQQKSISNRDEAVEERIKLANSLYKALVDLATKGKLCWGEISEARYNDYIITEQRSSKGHVTEGNVKADAIVNISVSGIKASTAITLENKGSVSLAFYFSDNPLKVKGSQPIIIAAKSRATHAVTALGYNETTGFTRLIVDNYSEKSGRYRVEWV